MKIALFADAHANLPAVKAALADAQRQEVSEVWYLGDFVGYGPYPDQVVGLLRRAAEHSIAGNYDRNVLQFPLKKDRWKHSKHPSKFFSFQWTFETLSDDSAKFLASLPEQLTLEYGGLKVLCVHGSPRGIDDPLSPDTPETRFIEIAAEVAQQVVLCGHTHHFFDKTFNGVRFINPGSVGRPFDGNTASAYAVLDFTGRGKLRVTPRRVAYDVKRVARKMSEDGFPRDMIKSIAEGLSLNAVHDHQYSSDDKALIDAVIHLARSCDYEKEHSHQVTRLALKLFDELQDLHDLPVRSRLLLQSASLLHDIGWVKGRVRHHKTSRDIILKSFDLPLSEEEKLIVALVARYHRRSLPRRTHKYYNELPKQTRGELKRLAALLRIADGLDRGHTGCVRDLSCKVKAREVVVHLDADGFSLAEDEAAQKKADLFRDTFRKALVLKWRGTA